MSLDEILDLTHGRLLTNHKSISIHHFQIDSRKIKKNDAFFAIVGEHLDGHHFIKEAIDRHASVIFVERMVYIKTKTPIIQVENVIETLALLAHLRRLQYPNIPLIAITGSAGKTTTKELTSVILEKKYHVLKTEGNLNNHLGLPLTLSKLNATYDLIVVELGMNHLGEIDTLSRICEPDLAVITNIGNAHIGNLGSKKNILKAKLEITHGMKQGILLLNEKDHYLNKIKPISKIQIERVGMDNEEFHLRNLEYKIDQTIFELVIGNDCYPITFHVPGKHIIADLTYAIKIGLLFQVPALNIVNVLNHYEPLKQRMSITYLQDKLLIDDCYNASYESFIGSLDLLKNDERKKLLILGDILELGKYSKKLHKKIGKKLKQLKNSIIVLTGEHMKKIYHHQKNWYYYPNLEELLLFLEQEEVTGDIILIKGSRKMQLEIVRDYLFKKMI